MGAIRASHQSAHKSPACRADLPVRSEPCYSVPTSESEKPTNMTIELIYDSGCPNVAKARENIAAALASRGLEPCWTEWDRSAPDSPGYVKGYGSPTILVGGRDVSGHPAGDGSACCRVYHSGPDGFSGAPSVAQIATALESFLVSEDKLASVTSGWKGSLATLPAVAAALLPAGLCPACWPAYAGLLSAFGLGFLLDEVYLFPLTAILLAVALGALALGARKRQGYGSFLLGLAATAVVLAGKFAFNSNIAMYAGIVGLITASVWNAWPVQSSSATCPTDG